MMDRRRVSMIQATAAEAMRKIGGGTNREFQAAERAAMLMFDQIYEQDAELKHLRHMVDQLVETKLDAALLGSGMFKVERVDPSEFYVHPRDAGARYWREAGKLHCKHGVILYGTKCVTCEREGP